MARRAEAKPRWGGRGGRAGRRVTVRSSLRRWRPWSTAAPPRSSSPSPSSAPSAGGRGRCPRGAPPSLPCRGKAALCSAPLRAPGPLRAPAPPPAGARWGCETRRSSGAPSQGAALPVGCLPGVGRVLRSRAVPAEPRPCKAPGMRGTHLPRRPQPRCPTGWGALAAECAGGGRDAGHGEPRGQSGGEVLYLCIPRLVGVGGPAPLNQMAERYGLHFGERNIKCRRTKERQAKKRGDPKGAIEPVYFTQQFGTFCF